MINEEFARSFNCSLIEKRTSTALTDIHSFWLVASGYADIFIVPIAKDGSALAQGEHCFRLQAGHIVLGCASYTAHDTLALYCYPSVDAQIYQGSAELFLQSDFDLNIVAKVDKWVQTLDECLGSYRPIPKKYQLLDADPDVPYKGGTFLSTHYLSVIWTRAESSSFLYGGHESMVTPPGKFIPVTHRATLKLEKDSLVSSCHTPQFMLRDDSYGTFQEYRQFFMQAMSLNVAAKAQATLTLQNKYRQNSRQQLDDSQRLLNQTLGVRGPPSPTHQRTGDSHLVSIIKKVLKDFNLDLPHSYSAETIRMGNFREIFECLGVGARSIKLDKWDYRRECFGHIICTNKKGHCVGFFPPLHNRKTYTYFSPSENIERSATAADLEDIPDRGTVVYPPLPDNVKTLKGLFKYALSGKRREVRKFLLIAMFNGLFFLVYPFLVSKLLTEYIPYQEMDAFFISLLGFFLAGAASIVIYFFNAALYISIKGHAFTYIQAGLWKKIISLPTAFFRKHSAGEIIDRVNSINVLDLLFNVSFAQAISSAVSAVVSLALLFFFNPLLAAIVSLIITAVIFVDYFIIKKFVSIQLKTNAMQFDINNFVFRIVNAITKLRVARRENFVLRKWVEKSTKKSKLNYRANVLRSQHLSLYQHFFYCANISIFFFIILNSQEFASTQELLASNYLIFNSALVQVSFAVMQAAFMSFTALSAISHAHKIKAIIGERSATPRRDIHLHNLHGKVEFSGVCFSYTDDHGNPKPVLHDISFTVNPGEYVAIVGASGSGKSTIIRLLLGFETPNLGSVRVDDHDLDTANISTIRKQIGAVLQSNQIIPSTVLKNISLGLEAASPDIDLLDIYRKSWSAARQASIHRDISTLPMNMDTWLGQGQGFSGGQKQRLLIARALSKQPRILIMDEATSMIDNATQLDIKKTLNNLNVTRIVIAHRLSTITDVHRVLMLKEGRIVEQGSFRGLVDAGGEFSKFAKRQRL